MPERTGKPLDVEKLRSVIAGALDLPVEEVTDDARFKEDLEVDSLISLEIAVRVEENYGVKIDESQLTEMGTFRLVRDLVADGLGAEPAA
ncbi:MULTISPECIES: acyl carrier protein [unclassified Streptomyces]|uniref:acyl carrier protein n=1 Tax=unclassified Streptomyces TaxID=2593676 RepID=UPI001368BF37|nr:MULTISPECIES: acyl carrier protein [unclassified Streptomyces]MCW5252767.1 acyl carrier protein [Streptomyces sp. SHP 1-2]MYU22062.1 acyl carrier protein [Streptomyces sp. SID8352]